MVGGEEWHQKMIHIHRDWGQFGAIIRKNKNTKRGEIGLKCYESLCAVCPEGLALKTLASREIRGRCNTF